MRPKYIYPQLMALGDKPMDALRAVYGPNPLPAVHEFIHKANDGDEEARRRIRKFVRGAGEL